MTSVDPIRSIEYLGYTEREASFLYLVAVHSGYFLRRQFDQFIDRHNGAIAQHFLLRARRRGHIAVLDFGQQRHVYHLFYKPFYRLLDNPDSQNRRRKSDAEIKLRLMALDYVLLHLSDDFLETREAKIRFFTGMLQVSPTDLPQAGRYSQVPFADHILISRAVASKTPRFVFLDEGIRSLARFEKFLAAYQRLFQELEQFELVYLSDSDLNFVGAGRRFEKLFPQSRDADDSNLFPKGPDHLLEWLRVRARYESGLGGLVIEDFLLLREGNLLYASPEYEKLYQQWRAKRFSAREIPTLLGEPSSAVSFRTELQARNYPIFQHRHLPRRAPAFHSIERSPHRSVS